MVIFAKNLIHYHGMNRKQEYLYKIVDICVKCCGYALSNGKLSITREDILGKNRNENVVMTRCIAVSMMLQAGFSVTTCSAFMSRTAPAIRHMIQLDRQLSHTSKVYRIASREAVRGCRELKEEEE